MGRNKKGFARNCIILAICKEKIPRLSSNKIGPPPGCGKTFRGVEEKGKGQGGFVDGEGFEKKHQTIIKQV